MFFNNISLIMVMLTAATNGIEQSGRFEPAEIPAYATSVRFRNYKLHTLPANLFLNFTKWTELSFYHMELSQIEAGAWNGLQNLITLRIGYNPLTVLQAGMFAGLTYLNQLYMSRNKISVIEYGAWEDLQKLELLNLNYNEITTLHAAGFQNLTSLTYLGLTNNEVEEIEYGAWEDLERLEILDLNNNKITVLHTNIFYNLTSLKQLNLGHNNIIVIETEAFQFCNSLSSLHLRGNIFEFNSSTLQSVLSSLGDTLTVLSMNMDPAEILTRGAFENIIHLRELEFSGLNSAEPSAFKDLDFLEKLVLSYSELNESTFKALESKVFIDVSDTLKRLDLRFNHITSLCEDMFINFGLLSELDLGWNQITVIEKGTFSGLKLLKHLKLARNHMKIKNINIKDLNETLETLDLSYNLITHIPGGYFEYFGVLQTIDLRSNSISVLSPNAFKGLPMLRYLDLYSNKLKTLQWNIFDSEDFVGTGGHPESLTLAIHGNLLICDERMQWIKDGEKDGWLRFWYSARPYCKIFPGGDWDDIKLPKYPGYRCSKLNCSDPDKCELQECSKNATCSEDGDPHECSCNTGFSGDGLVCDNINECDDGSHNCSIYATCIDNIGSYSCYCNQGFSGDGLVCDNINDVHKISDLFEKTEVTTFATSVAFRDYELSTLSGDGLVSDNVNKCNDDSHNCSTYATCTDNEGPYSCQCKEWFSGDGRSCIFEGCPAGNYATNSNTCEKCPINTYNNIRNNFLRECIPCPNYYTTENQGSTSRTECKMRVKCSIGHYTDGTTGECTRCIDGTYQSRALQSSCLSCPTDKPRTGGGGATSENQCVTNETQTLKFAVELKRQQHYVDVITHTMTHQLLGIRYFEQLHVLNTSSQNRVVDFEASVLDHPDAECIFFNRLYNLDLNTLLPGAEIMGGNPCSDDFLLTNLEPQFGPQSGGTLVTIHGNNLDLYGSFVIKMGEVPCLIATRKHTEVICQTEPLEDLNMLNLPQSVAISWTSYVIDDLETRLIFTYKPDPVIETIHPNITITSGGIPITVTGENVDSVQEPVMVVVIVRVDVTVSSYDQPCKVVNSTHFVCSTPDINEGTTEEDKQTQQNCGFIVQHRDLQHNIQVNVYQDITEFKTKCSDKATQGKEECTVHLNISIIVEFIMDGANPRQGTVPTFPIQVKAYPKILPHSRDMSFHPTPPCNDDTIYIRGEDLLRGVGVDLYKVTVGEEICAITEVTDTIILCKPPKNKPKYHTVVKVTIGAGCFQEDVYTLEYGGLFDCKLTQYITIGCSVFFISVVVVVIITCYKCYRRRRSQQSQRRAESNRYELPSRPQQYTELPMRPESSGFGSQISSISIGRSYLEPVANDYDYPEFILPQQNDTGSGPTGPISDYYEGGSSETYFTQGDPDGYDDQHLNHASIAESRPSAGYLKPELTSSTIETLNNLDPSPPETSNIETGSQESRDRHAQTNNADNKRLSTRFFPRHFASERNYPNAAKATNQRMSQWLSSAACGIKKYGGFIDPIPRPRCNSDN